MSDEGLLHAVRPEPLRTNSQLIPYGRHDISEADIQSVVDVLRSDFLTQGPTVPAFEESVRTYTGGAHAVAVNSATSALHIACLALGVGPGDWVWTSPITFVASANCALYCGAQVDFVDIDAHTYNISVERLAEKLEAAERDRKLPKVVIPVHLCGQPCEMHEIRDLSKRYGFRVIEDASHAVGGRYRDERVGNCKYSDITVFSFHPVKIITTGEGGMALTNDRVLADQMRLLRTHGITRDADLMTHPPDGPWYYQQIELGFNYRMTDIHAALGVSQMQRIDDFVRNRHGVAKRYDEAFRNLPVTTPWQLPGTSSALHLYVIRINAELAGVSRNAVFDALRGDGIGVNLHYVPVYLQPFYQRMGFGFGYCPEAERYYEEAISLPMYSTLSVEQQGRVVGSLVAALG